MPTARQGDQRIRLPVDRHAPYQSLRLGRDTHQVAGLLDPQAHVPRIELRSDGDALHLAAAGEGEVQGPPLAGAHGFGKRSEAPHRIAVDREDQIARPQSAALRRRIRLHAGDQHAGGDDAEALHVTQRGDLEGQRFGTFALAAPHP
jgi:hypothetical protein